MSLSNVCIAALAVTGTLLTTLAHAEEAKPRWEAGVAVAAYSYPDWRGADHRNTTVLPLPYFIYRGERVRVAREGLKIRLLDSDRISLNIAAAFSLSGKAKDNPLRAGMPRLLNTFQAGPVLSFNLNQSDADLLRWDLRLPVYAVAATDFKTFKSAGVTAFPQLRTHSQWQGGAWTYRAGGSVGAEFLSEQNSDYFYQVRASEARAGRPAYDAKSGYGGAVLSGFTSATRGRWGYGLYARLDALQGASFEDSPLVQTKSFWSAGLGVSYRFFESAARDTDGDSD